MTRGYDETRIEDVAAAAGVAVQTMYYTFQTKERLLAETEPFAILGDRPDTDWATSPSIIALTRVRTADRLIERFVAIDTDIKARHAPFVLALGRHLPDSDEAQQRKREGRDAFFGLFVDRLQAIKQLRPGLTPQRALDIVVALNSLGNYIELTRERGWTDREWRIWLADTLRTQLTTD